MDVEEKQGCHKVLQLLDDKLLITTEEKEMCCMNALASQHYKEQGHYNKTILNIKGHVK